MTTTLLAIALVLLALVLLRLLGRAVSLLLRLVLVAILVVVLLRVFGPREGVPPPSTPQAPPTGQSSLLLAPARVIAHR